MSCLTDEFEKVKFYDRTLSFPENQKRAEIRDNLIKEMSDEEFELIIQKISNIQAKIYYKRIRNK